jgi:hypothetical protein
MATGVVKEFHFSTNIKFPINRRHQGLATIVVMAIDSITGQPVSNQ